MATKIVTKNSSTASAVPTASDLVQGELAVNVADKRLFTEDNGGSVVELGTNPSSLTVSGNIDVDGVTNLDVVDIDGAVDMASTLAVGGRTTSANATIGSGTASTYVDLTVNGASTSNYGPMIELQSAGTAFGKISNAGRIQGGTSTDMFVTTASTNSLVLGTNNTPNVTIANGGAATFGGTVTASSGATVGSLSLGDNQYIFLGGGNDGRIHFDGTDTLNITASNGSATTLNVTANNFKIGGASRLISGAVNDSVVINEDSGDVDFRVESNGNANMLFVDGGNNAVGIGTSSPRVTASVIGLTIGNSTTGGSELVLRENTGNDWRIFNNGFLAFIDDTTERFRIDASGNLLVGNTDSTPYDRTSGNAIALGDGLISSAQSGGNAAIFNRMTNDGSIVGFRKDGSTVGSIGTANGDLHIDGEASHSGIRFQAGSLLPRLNGADTNGTIDLGYDDGSAIHRFKNLYLSGGVYANNASGAFLWNAENAHIVFGTNNAERMRIDSSGNVGIGTSSPSTKVEISGTGFQTLSVTSTNSSPVLKLNSAASSTAFLQWNNAGSSPLSFYDLTASAERMRIDSSGNVGIGTSSPARKLVVENDASTSDNSSISIISGNAGFAQLLLGDSDADVRGYLAYKNSDDSLQIGVNNSERMRIDSSGNLLVGATSVGGAGGLSIRPNASTNATQLMFNRANSTSRSYITDFQNNGTTVGTISYTNTSTDYATSSDQRLKENIADADDAGSKVDAIQVRKFDWKADGSHQDYGMIAQELQTVAPEAVSGDADSEEMMGVDYSKLVPMLIKEIQSLRNRVAQLEE